MISVVPNSGIFNDDALDRLRGEAIGDSQDGLPDSVVYYLRALEERLLRLNAEQKARALRDIGWKLKPAPEATP